MSSSIISTFELVEEGLETLVKASALDFSDDIVKLLAQLTHLILHYSEEGETLYPEVVVIDDIKKFKSVPAQIMKIESGISCEISDLKRVIKLTAPLCVDGWIIYLVIRDSVMDYGLVNSRITELSMPIYEHLVGDLKGQSDLGAIYIRNIAPDTVEVSSEKNPLIISFQPTTSVKSLSSNDILLLAEEIVKDVGKENFEQIRDYMNIILNSSIRESHGSLVAVVKKEQLSSFRQSVSRGVFLKDTIKFPSLIESLKIDNSVQASVLLRQNSTLLKKMLNHDGLTIITTECEVIGYHFILKNKPQLKSTRAGGSRTLAFESLKTIPSVHACFFRSQDGDTELWRKDYG